MVLPVIITRCPHCSAALLYRPKKAAPIILFRHSLYIETFDWVDPNITVESQKTIGCGKYCYFVKSGDYKWNPHPILDSNLKIEDNNKWKSETIKKQ